MEGKKMETGNPASTLTDNIEGLSYKYHFLR